MGWYQRWTSFVPFSSSVPARNPSQVAWYPLSNSPPDFRVPSTFQAGENFFPKKFNEQRKIATEEIYDKQREENRIFFFFFWGGLEISTRVKPIVWLLRDSFVSFRVYPFLVSRSFRRYRGFSINTPTPGLEEQWRQLGAHSFFKLFSINLLLLVFLFNVHVYICRN